MSQPQERTSTHPKTIGHLGPFALSLLLLTTGALYAEEPQDIERLISQGELHAAVEKIQSQLKQYPNDFSLLLQVGKLNLSLAKYKKGIAHLTHAAKIDPTDFRAPYHRGIAHLKQGQFILAEQSLGEALALNQHDRDIPALHFLAATKNTSPTTSPEELLKRYPLRTEYPETYFIRAIWHFSRGEIDLAEYFVAAVADIVPQQKMVWYQSWLSDSGWVTPSRIIVL